MTKYLDKFNAVEMELVASFNDGKTIEVIDTPWQAHQCENFSGRIFYSIYGRLKEGHVECLFDIERIDLEEARQICEELFDILQTHFKR